VNEIRFVVEHAGCSSCARRVRDALTTLTTVWEVDVDENADVAAVRVAASPGVTPATVGAALEEASAGAGHEYRVQAGSWSA
jgi:cation transport ATPase